MEKQQNKTPIPEELFIDTHLHILPENRLSTLIKWMKKIVPHHPVAENVTQEQLVTDLKNNGVTHFFNLVYPLKPEETLPLNHFNGAFCEKIPGAIGFAGMHPANTDKARIAAKAFREYPFLGVKLHPFIQKFDPWDPRMDELYGFLAEINRPVVMHTGFEDFYRRPMPLDKLARLMRTYPTLSFVFVHLAFPHLEEVFGMMDDFPQLYLDATGVLAFMRPSFKTVLPSSLRGDTFLRVLVDGFSRCKGRIFLGSDHPVGWGSLEEVYADLASLSLSHAEQHDLMGQAPFEFVARFLPDFNWYPHLQHFGNSSAHSSMGNTRHSKPIGGTRV